MPTYFRDRESLCRVDRKHRNQGFRRAQYGAIHAVLSHFSLKKGPFMVVLPTGLGKTAVLTALPFLIPASRVLVIAPSRLIREQVSSKIRTLSELKRIGAIPQDVELPRVSEVEGRLATRADWQALAEFDVVVGLPNSISPHYADVAQPPENLFDLILVDEGHHEPAETWKATLAAFPNQKRVLFTATPFRRDKEPIGYEDSYIFPLAEAIADGEYAEIRFDPVYPLLGEAVDEAIALRTQAIFRADHERGLDHRVLVRTDRVAKGLTLQNLYNRVTDLRLESISNENSLEEVFAVIGRARRGEIDGLISVNMLGEGFDMQELKIAALHSPQRSLEGTLQFIGRLSRIGSERLGNATVVASPDELKGPLEALASQDASWSILIPRLTDFRLEEVEQERVILRGFSPPLATTSQSRAIPLNLFHPRFHAFVYRPADRIVLRQAIAGDMNAVEYITLNREQNALIWVGAERVVPRWLNTQQLVGVIYHLYVVHYHQPTGLLFVMCSSESELSADDIATAVCGSMPSEVPLFEMEKVLLDISSIQCFNYGMRNNFPLAAGEVYRIVAGPEANLSLNPSDGTNFHKGHVTVKGKENGRDLTVGFATSKVWSLQGGGVASLMTWFDWVARKIVRDEAVRTLTQLDYLAAGEAVTTFPENPLYGMWDRVVYFHGPELIWQTAAGEVRRVRLDQCDVDVIHEDSGLGHTRIAIRSPELELRCDMTLQPPYVTFIGALDGSEAHEINLKGRRHTVEGFLREFPVTLHFSDQACLTKNTFYRSPLGAITLYPDSGFSVHNWAAICNVRREEGENSIHLALEHLIEESSPALLYYDHSPGEMADYVAMFEDDERVIVQLFHCKKSGADAPRAQIDDLYEVIGQASRCAARVGSFDNLAKHIAKRCVTIAKGRFAVGSAAQLTALVQRARRKVIRFEIFAVQPGLSAAAVTPNIRDLLGGVNDFCRRSHLTDLTVMCSQ